MCNYVINMAEKVPNFRHYASIRLETKLESEAMIVFHRLVKAFPLHEIALGRAIPEFVRTIATTSNEEPL